MGKAGLAREAGGEEQGLGDLWWWSSSSIFGDTGDTATGECLSPLRGMM